MSCKQVPLLPAHRRLFGSSLSCCRVNIWSALSIPPPSFSEFTPKKQGSWPLLWRHLTTREDRFFCCHVFMVNYSFCCWNCASNLHEVVECAGLIAACQRCRRLLVSRTLDHIRNILGYASAQLIFRWPKKWLNVLYSPLPQKLELYVLSLPWTQSSGGWYSWCVCLL